MTPLLAFGLGYGEMMVVGLIALLLFGKRLPEVARSLGKGVTEFKKGLHGLEEELDQTGSATHRELPHSTESQAPRAPKFEPPTSPPTEARPESGAAPAQPSTPPESPHSPMPD